MKKLILISALLLVASNGWTNEAYDNCIAIAEEIKTMYLSQQDWSKEEEYITKLESLIERSADVARRKAESESDMSGATSTMGGAWLDALVRSPRRGQLAADKERLRLEQELGIHKLKLDLELRKADSQREVDESRRRATKEYLEGLKICAQLKDS